jgi:hypothetical protein
MSSNHGARLEPSEGQWRINFLPAVLVGLAELTSRRLPRGQRKTPAFDRG